MGPRLMLHDDRACLAHAAAARARAIRQRAESKIRALRHRIFRYPVACLLILSFASASFIGEARAQNAAEVYPRSYFEPFNPQTARDMVDRIPGFSFDPGGEVRGFSGAGGNVLIDGARPTTKSGGIEEALTRIPARDVDRIEVIRGAAGAGEAQGQSVVANVIRAGNKRSASWKLEIERNSEGVVYPRAEGALTARIGDWSTSTKLTGFWEQFDLVGRRDRLDPSGNIVRAQAEDRPSAFTQGFASTEASRPLAGGKLTLNARTGYSGFFSVTDRALFDAREPDLSPDGRTYIDLDSIEWTGEASAGWTRTFENDWTFKALTLATVKPLDEVSTVRSERPVGAVATRSVFTNKQTPIEAIARLTVARGGDRALRPEFGGEIAYNRLTSQFTLTNFDASGIATPIILPAADVLVEELRGEAFANAIWKASPRVTFETGLAVEASRISVSGDATSEQTFFFAKPFANVLYQLSDETQLRFSARRSVGQLDFTDFAASAEADLDREFGGNPELGPDQTTRLSAAIDWRRDAIGALNVEVFHEWRSDVLEQLVLPSGAFGVANAGSGRLYGVAISSSLKLQPVIPGGLLEVRATVRGSIFDDPITGGSRALNDVGSPNVTVNFRQDLVKSRLSWGAKFIAPETTRSFFADETSVFRSGSELSLFVESTRWLGVKSRLTLRGVGGRDFDNDRVFFSPDRSGAVTGLENAPRVRGMFINLTVEGQS